MYLMEYDRHKHTEKLESPDRSADT